MHTCYLLSSTPKVKQILNPFKMFTVVFSGLCHDVGHTGFTNLFEIASHSKKAITYNDSSVITILFSLFKITMHLTHLSFLESRKITSWSVLHMKKWNNLENQWYLTFFTLISKNTSHFLKNLTQFLKTKYPKMMSMWLYFLPW